MGIRNISYILSTIIMSLLLSGCNWFRKDTTKETIFDKIVSIPKELVLNIPNLPPLCDELPGLKKSFIDIEAGKLYCEEEGQGMPLVLISGSPGCTHQVFHPYFSQIKDVARIIYYDQRGTGESSQFEESGHKIFADEPEKFFELLQIFLKNITLEKK